MAAYDLLIFDFDGTLVPTEELASRLMQGLMAEHLDIHMSEIELIEHFRGRDLETQFVTISGFYGAPIPQTFIDALEKRWMHAVKNELEPSQGVMDALEELKDIPHIIASNGSRNGIATGLESTGLNAYFDRFVCVEDVDNPKPAPDLFFEAAARMGVDPTRCLVIEDSVLGTLGALSAGMEVVGYAGNDTSSEAALKEAGARVIHHFRELPPLVLT